MATFPPAEDPIWDRLVTGEVRHKFALFAANLCVDNAVRDYQSVPADKAKLKSEIFAFFKKYEELTAAELADLQ